LSSDPNRGSGCLWCPAPATPAPRERRRIQCEIGSPSFEERCRITAARLSPNAGLARSTAPSAATDGVPERARQHSPTSAIDAKPEHTGERSLPGAPPLFTAKRCASRRSGGAKPHRPFESQSQLRARHGSQLWDPTWTSKSPAPAPTHWRVTGCSGASLGSPRERRANARTLGNEPGCLSLHGIRPFLFDPDWPRSAGFLGLPCPRLLSPVEGGANR
jgi:hypothetical protein